MTRAQAIFEEVQRHGIPHLLHFTLEANLPSILKHGLLSRQEIFEKGIEALGTDPNRRDSKLDPSCPICVTVTRFQKTYLDTVRRRDPNDSLVILVIKPDLLWENECLFCNGNASSNYIIRTRRNLTSSHAFRTMFDDRNVQRWVDGELVSTSYREDHNLPFAVPTDPQAEVLVRGEVSADYIEKIWVESSYQKERLESMLAIREFSGRAEVIVGQYELSVCDPV